MTKSQLSEGLNAHHPSVVKSRQSRAGALVALALALCCLTGLRSTAGAEVASAKEYELKAAFIYNFIRFVEWPADRFQEDDSPIVIAVVGATPVAAALETAVYGRTINGRPLIVKITNTSHIAQTVHLLFVPASQDQRLADQLPTSPGSGVLTVGETETFAQQGGIITFAIEGAKLRFDINMDSAKQAGLKVSAQLQKLARSVRGE